MERIVLLRSCHPLVGNHGASDPLVESGELHVTVSVTPGDSISGTPHKDTVGGSLGLSGEGGLGVLTNTVVVPLSRLDGRVDVQDMTSNPLFHQSDEVAIFCVLPISGGDASSPVFSSYTKVGNFTPSVHGDVTVISHVGLRLANDRVGVCLTLLKAPSTSDRGIEGAMMTEHMRCFNEHVVQWQLEKMLLAKNVAVDELIQSDILLSEEIRRQRFGSSPSETVPGCDEVVQLRARVKELELERVKELEAMRKLIAERRAEREAHIEARLREAKDAKTKPTPLGGRTASTQIATSVTSGRTTPARASTPVRSATTGARGVGASVSRPVTTPQRSPATTAVGRSSTPSRVVSTSARTPLRPSTPTRPTLGTPGAGHATAGRRGSLTPAGPKSPIPGELGATPSAQAAMLKRAEENLMRLRNDAPRTTGGAVGTRAAPISTTRQSPSVSLRNSSPIPSRSVPPPPADARASPLRNTACVSGGASSVRKAIASTPPRCATPNARTPVASQSGRASPLLKNPQTLIRMARQ